MIFMRILPGVLKELTKHVPTILFQVVEWSELASELPKISKRIIQKEGHSHLFDKLSDYLKPINVQLTHENLQPEKVVFDKWAGKKWLELYFAQLFSPSGLFLDLRAANFATDKPTLKWKPTGLWTQFNEEFRLGLLDVYDGFYLEDEELYYKGLTEVGLISPDWPDTDKKKLGDLFKAQFGKASSSEVNFEMGHFQASMFKTFNFILTKKGKITKDFLYLGIYLVTLYASLSETKEELPVKEIYLNMRKQFKR